MAKQISAPDPVSAAMSAIESALNLTDDDNLATNDSPPPAAPISAAKPAFVTPVLRPAAPQRRGSAAAAPKLDSARIRRRRNRVKTGAFPGAAGQ